MVCDDSNRECADFPLVEPLLYFVFPSFTIDFSFAVTCFSSRWIDNNLSWTCFFLPLSWVWHVPCNALSSWQNAQCALKIEKKLQLKLFFKFFAQFLAYVTIFQRSSVTTKKPKSIFSVRHVYFALFSNFITHCVLYTKSSSAVEASRDQAGCK